MKLRVAKKILKNQSELGYHKGQIKKATTVAGRQARRIAKSEAKKA